VRWQVVRVISRQRGGNWHASSAGSEAAGSGEGAFQGAALELLCMVLGSGSDAAKNSHCVCRMLVAQCICPSAWVP